MTRYVDVDLTVKGLPEALRELKRVDPALRKAIPNRFKEAAAPILAEARSLVPTRPLSGWSEGGRFGWKPSAVRRSITLRFRGSRGRRRSPNEFTILTITSGKSAALSLYDMAGRRNVARTKQGRAFLRGVAREGQASRVLWEAVERKEPYVRDEVAKIIKDVERAISRKIEVV